MTHPELSREALEGRGVLVPEAGEGSSEAVERSPGIVCLLAGAVAVAQERQDERGLAVAEQPDEVGVGERGEH